ncbi:MAG: ribonucleoside-triphosphate reductase, adenosylcobalamin-dependent [Cyanobacteria bacterium QS_8_64_29]|nr:MAG: ribonucleoside-triphosphate reductase, adenosylcobalamin-dependent [Cyanobacteria bacterium QS_8_64_29]
MVRQLESPQTTGFPANAPAANPVFFRTYSRLTAEGQRESWAQVCDRAIGGLVELGQLTGSECELLERTMRSLQSLPAGRWLWVGGTPWLQDPQNYSGAYNCTSTDVVDWRTFGLMMDLAMMGCGTGAVLERYYIERLPAIRNQLEVRVTGTVGTVPAGQRREATEVDPASSGAVHIQVGDSRQGWIRAYQALLELASDGRMAREIAVTVDPSHVRPAGELLKGFGGVANPIKFPDLFPRMAAILNRAIGRQLNAEECCLLIDEAAATIVAGNIRRSAGIRQFDADFPLLKQNLWQPDEQGNWRIDPERDALRMANHTRVFHTKPDRQTCIEAVRSQYHSGEGAIQWAGEAVARANADLADTPERKAELLAAYERGDARGWLQQREPSLDANELDHRVARYGLNPCLTADTWIHTESGPRQVRELIGQPANLYVDGVSFSTTAEGFFYTGTQPVYELETERGYRVRLTANHPVLRVSRQTQKRQRTEWIEAGKLQPGDRIKLHDHRSIQPWCGHGTFEQGWLLGELIGDGSLSRNEANYSRTGILRFWEGTKQQMADKTIERGGGQTAILNRHNNCLQVSSAQLYELVGAYDITPNCKTVTPAIERASYEFYQGFLRGLFDSDGSVQGNQQKGISIRLSQSDLPLLEAVQRMLARLGIAATLYRNRRPAGYRLMPDSDRNPAAYRHQAQHELVVTGENLSKFKTVIDFDDPEKSDRLSAALANYQRTLNRERFVAQLKHVQADGIEPVYDCTVPQAARFDANGLVVHNCGEIIGSNFHCNLSEIHLNQIDPSDEQAQREAFQAGALSVAALLHHRFVEPRYQYSRELDPIVGVSFTGLFDFCVQAFGVDWLHWWEQGRPDTEQGRAFKRQEQQYLQHWRSIVRDTIWDYCDRHGLKRPNRYTCVQPSGTKSLLTGASPGWHPPKAARYLRRITFRKNDPVALACIDYGYNVIPAQSDKDDNGNLLDDPFDERCTEWLVEIPVSLPWADLPGADAIDISSFSALAQFDFYMQVQRYWTTHNTSATLEFREGEIEALGDRIHRAIRDDEGYISAALLARFDDHQSFPRLPFEPIGQQQYEQLMAEVRQRCREPDFYAALQRYDAGAFDENGPAACDSDRCLFPGQ